MTRSPEINSTRRDTSFVPILEALKGFVRALEPGEYGGPDVPVMLARFAEAEKLCGAAKVLMARRRHELETSNPGGHRSADQQLSTHSGQPTGRARRDLATAARLPDQPELESAMRAGVVSPEQANLISPAIEANPNATDQLIETARRGSFRDLRDACREVVAASLSEQEAIDRDNAIRERRHLVIGTSESGGVYVRGLLPQADGALVQTVLGKLAGEVFHEARRAGLRQAHEAYQADALTRLCAAWADGAEPGRGSSAGTGGSPEPPPARIPRAEIVLHVSAEALRRGSLEDGEICEIEGVGPVALATVEELLGAATAKLVVAKGVDVCAITHLGRYIPAHLNTALRARDRVCAVPHCGVSRGLERDHVIPVTEGGPTELDNLVRLCSRHHYLKTHKFWRLEGRPGAWSWVNIRSEQPLGRSDGTDVAPPGEPTSGLARPVLPLPPLHSQPGDRGEAEPPPPSSAPPPSSRPPIDDDPPPEYRQQTFGCTGRRRVVRLRT